MKFENKRCFSLLTIITGRSGTGKTEKIHQKICQNACKGNVILIVPEQSSFQNEKRILDSLGAKTAAKVQVFSFKRLFEIVLEKYGGQTKKRIDDGVKAVLMSLAIEQASDKLVLYERRSRRSDLAELMLTAVHEYKMCDISPDEVMEMSKKIKNKKLSEKLSESAIIYSAYNAILGDTYADPSDDISRLYDILCENSFFDGCDVYIDGFSGFSAQEQKIIDCIIRQAENITAAVGCDIESFSDISTIFREPDITYGKLIKMAENNGIDTEIINLDVQQRFKAESLADIEESIFRFDGDCYQIDDNAVKLYEAQDEYDEIRQAARDILMLVRNEKYSYNDIVIICRNIEDYSTIIRSEFPKAKIPYFLSAPEALETKPLVRLVLSVFEVIHSSYSTESILTLIKTNLTPIDNYDVYELENYVYMWGIKGKRWKSEFTMNPDGNTADIDREKLDKLEEMRKMIILPLEKFGNILKSEKDGGKITEALYELLCDFHIDIKVRNLAEDFDKSGDIRSMEEEADIWDIMMKILDKMYTVLINKQIGSKRYFELLKLMLSKNTISDIPQTIDSVTVGVAGNIRSENPKAVFIIGAVENVFPQVPFPVGIFSDSERSELINNDMPLYETVDGMICKEKYNIYLALSSARENLFISWYKNKISGENTEPSIIYREISKIFGKISVRNFESLSDEEIFFTDDCAFEYCSEIWNENDRRSDTLKAYFENDIKYSENISAIKRAASDEPYKIKDKANTKKLFGKVLHLSASKLEDYNNCPFYYFCRHGLKIFPRKKADIDSGIYGSAAHHILEKIFKTEGLDLLNNASDEEIENIVRKHLDTFIESIGGSEERTERFSASCETIVKNIIKVIKRLIEEFKNSEFIPVDFELNIGGKKADIPEYKLDLPNGEKVIISGQIDRVDVYKKDDEKYIRIVDYKTGEKSFSLFQVLYGLNMQMLIYLSAIGKNEDYYSENGQYKIIPAGVLYMPSTPAHSKGDIYDIEGFEKAMEKQQKSMKMNGLIISDPNILSAMEKGLGGVFIPAKRNKDNSLRVSENLISAADFGKLFDYIDKKIISMAQSLLDGKIEACPTKYKYSACKYCDYKSACGFEEGKPVKRVIPVKFNDALAEIKGNGEKKDE